MQTANKGELLIETKEKATTVIIKEFSAGGVKLQYNAQGEVSGKYSGAHLETVDIVQKADGTFEYEARGIDTTKDGDLLLLTGKGTGKQVDPTGATFQGTITFMTQSKNLGWLNSTKAIVERSISAWKFHDRRSKR